MYGPAVLPRMTGELISGFLKLLDAALQSFVERPTKVMRLHFRICYHNAFSQKAIFKKEKKFSKAFHLLSC